jgi:sulfate permease, SulP family
VRGANRKIVAAVDAAQPRTVVVDVSAAPVLPVTVLDEFADLQRELDTRGVTLWIAALPPQALATARQQPGWAAAVSAGRVFPTSLAAARAYVGPTPTERSGPGGS